MPLLVVFYIRFNMYTGAMASVCQKMSVLHVFTAKLMKISAREDLMFEQKILLILLVDVMGKDMVYHPRRNWVSIKCINCIYFVMRKRLQKRFKSLTGIYPLTFRTPIGF